jgi:hypothetical protein
MTAALSNCVIWCGPTLWLICFANELGHSLQEYGWALPALRMIVRHDTDSMDVHEHNREVAYSRFSAEQLRIAEEVVAAVASGHGGIFYVQAGGGCGKSFWANGVSAALSVQGQQPIMVAASALAASVLRGGRTAHAMFHIPIECDEHSFCSFSSETLDLMKSTNIIIWDECSMVHVDVAECVNRSLQDVSKSSQPFGGKVVVFMGDFQQLLPVAGEAAAQGAPAVHQFSQRAASCALRAARCEQQRQLRDG